MRVVFGLVIVLLSLLAWGGQTLSWLAPPTAQRLGLMEPEGAVEPVYFADIEGEARWDAAILWTLIVAGVLLVFDQRAWAYFGLAGGGSYLYFAGRGIVTRRVMQRRGYRIGTPGISVTSAYVALTVWGVLALVIVAAAVVELQP